MASSTVQSASTLASTIVNKIAGNLINNATLDTLNESNVSDDSESLFQLWLYGAGAVIFISVVGLAAIMAIPVIYNHHVGLIQLLIGLAIGTLTGDALLHLLPHALMDPHHKHPNIPPPSSSSILTTTEHSVHDHHGHSHDHHDHHDHGSSGHETPIAASIEAIDSHLDPHIRSVIYGLMALVGIVGLLVFERVLTIVSDFCSQNSKKSAKIASCTRSANDKLSNHNHTSEKVTPELEKLTEPVKMADEKKDAVETTYHPTGNTNNDIQLTTEQCHRETIVYQHADPDRGFVVQLTDHHHHHHHQKQHQKGGKSFIMMIVTGDGMHNFFDGLAIGVAFAGSGIGGGLSTSVAILCHELPHEIGDFAVLLNAGLSTKRAVMYNTLSAVLCFIGMTVGIVVGKMDTGFLSAIIAGMFLYIALVNMVPQLDCCPTQSSTTRAFKLSIQLIGISIGVAIMCVISIYETKLQTLLQ